jgi:hypothetical protein
MKNECYCSKCDWEGSIGEAKTKHFGAYRGTGYTDTDTWGWEEWDDLVCPKCDTVLEYNDIEEDTSYLYHKNEDGSVSYA